MPGSNLPLQVTNKTIPSNLDSQNHPNNSEISASNDNSFYATNHQFRVQKTATYLFSQINKTQRGIPMYSYKIKTILNATAEAISNVI